MKQGDYSYDGKWFVFRNEIDNAEIPLEEESILGVVVLSQTCDIVRNPKERPYLEVCPLVYKEDDHNFEQIKKGRMPRYAYVPALQDKKLVADLDRIMTITKVLASQWSFAPGFTTEEGERAFALSLARKRSRFAFTDDLVELLQPFQQRILKKHDKHSEEGEFLSSMGEIRLRISPMKDGGSEALHFYFLYINLPTDSRQRNRIEQLCIEYVDLVEPNQSYPSIDCTLATYNEISAFEYIHSIPLDLEQLSVSGHTSL